MNPEELEAWCTSTYDNKNIPAIIRAAVETAMGAYLLGGPQSEALANYLAAFSQESIVQIQMSRPSPN